MAKSKAKKLAKKKSPAKRAPARKAVPQPQAQVQAVPGVFPRLVHVNKGAEKIPVQVKDAAHLAKLHEEFGAANVLEVQS